MKRVAALMLAFALCCPSVKAAGGTYQDNITRAEFCAIIMLLIETVGSQSAGMAAVFTDTDDPYVLKAAELGIVNGVGDGLFDPFAPLTRAQAARMLMNAGLILSLSLPTASVVYDDSDEIRSWALDGVSYAASYGLIQNISSSRFLPDQPYSRQDGILAVGRLYRMIRNK